MLVKNANIANQSDIFTRRLQLVKIVKTLSNRASLWRIHHFRAKLCRNNNRQKLKKFNPKIPFLAFACHVTNIFNRFSASDWFPVLGPIRLFSVIYDLLLQVPW
jgi:hypothetical protein